MRNKILQLNSSARDKLVQLGIFNQTKQAFTGIASFEDTLGSILNKQSIPVQAFLKCLIENSRSRFTDEMDKDIPESMEPFKEKTPDTSQNNIKPEMLGSKTNVQKRTSPIPTVKTAEDTKSKDNIRIRNIEPNTLSRKDLAKVGRTSATIKSVDSRPSFDFRESASDAPKEELKATKKEMTRLLEMCMQNESVTEQMNCEKGTLSNTEFVSGQDHLALSINLNTPNMNNEKNFNNSGANISSRMSSSVKKVKISTNKKSICIEETIPEPQPEKPKVNKDAWQKNYDILKVEYQALPVATKKETKKLLLEKIYKELVTTNTDIKKTIKRYRSGYLSYAEKRQSEAEAASDQDVSTPYTSDVNRPKSLNAKPSSYSTPSKHKSNIFSQNIQRNIMSVENSKDTETFDTDSFSNILNPFNTTSSSNAARQGKDTPKKQISQKFLVLPKLNLYPETPPQGVVACWPVSAQGSKSIPKTNFIMDFPSRSKFDNKPQKTPEKPAGHLTPNKNEIDQDNLNMSLVSQSLGIGTGAGVYSRFSNKSGYPLTLQPLESGNKPIYL